VVAKLKQVGADVEATTDDGVKAIHFACLKGHLNIVILLISFGAQVNIPDK
jgi:ankyrin repeat protein